MRKIFEKVNLVTPIEQRRFFNYFEDSVNELMTLYNGFVFEKGTEYIPPASLDDNCVVLPLYHDAIVDNILFLASSDQTYKGEFIRKSKLAYLTYWNEGAKGKRQRRMRW